MNMNTSKNKIVKLENNKEYFVMGSLVDDKIEYRLLLNLIDENDKKIVKVNEENGELYFIEVVNEKDLANLKSRFNTIITEKQKELLEN